MMRIMGLDVGSVRIGVALSDELLVAAHPLCTLARRGTEADVAALLALCAEHEVGELVIGLPLELDGRAGHRVTRVRALGERLAAGFSGPVHEWDERLSTVAAERVLLEADLSRAKRKQAVDRVAAAFILQGFLDSRATARAPEQP